jgi:membrane associated rhomboid family serine protease
MIEAPVGYQCPDCVEVASRRAGVGILPFGGRASRDPRTTSRVLVGLNGLVWLAILLTGSSGSLVMQWLALHPVGVCLSTDPGSYFPGVGQAGCTMLGAEGNWVPGVATGAWWQLVTSAFVHISPLHILGNMAAVWFIGPPLEAILGRTRFLAVYVVSLIGGSTAVMWLSEPESTTLGASGAVFGLLGSLLLLTIRGKGDVRGVLMWLGINLAITVFGASLISWQGHLGGLVAGLAVTGILLTVPRATPRRSLVQWSVIGGIVVLCAVLSAVRIAMLG